MYFIKGSFVLAVACLYLTGCASGAFKARQEQRDKLVGSSGLYCEFVNGEQHPDIDVELNMQMAKRCDSSKPFSITNYKTSSEMNGVMYCCQVSAAGSVKATAKATSAPTSSAPAVATPAKQPVSAPKASAPAPKAAAPSTSSSDESDDVIIGE